MFRRLFERWRCIDLDRIRPRHGSSAEQVTGAFNTVITDDGHSHRPVDRLLRCILLQALLDRALGVHFFVDDEDESLLRMLYCLALPPERAQDPWVPPSSLPFDGPRMNTRPCADAFLVYPDPTNASYDRVWFEMVPPPPEITERLFDRLRRYSGVRPGAAEGTLRIRCEGRDLTAAVVAPWPDDYRIFFGAERPPIRSKLRRQFEEVGLPYPAPEDTPPADSASV